MIHYKINSYSQNLWWVLKIIENSSHRRVLLDYSFLKCGNYQNSINESNSFQQSSGPVRNLCCAILPSASQSPINKQDWVIQNGGHSSVCPVFDGPKFEIGSNIINFHLCISFLIIFLPFSIGLHWAWKIGLSFKFAVLWNHTNNAIEKYTSH